MADYYSILKKTVSGLPSNTAETRRAVYAKARAAIDRQLRSINPPPSEDAIARQMGLLEQAISEIDEEFAPAPSKTVIAERSAEAPKPETAPLSVTRPVATPQPKPQPITQKPAGPTKRYSTFSKQNPPSSTPRSSQRWQPISTG